MTTTTTTTTAFIHSIGIRFTRALNMIAFLILSSTRIAHTKQMKRMIKISASHFLCRQRRGRQWLILPTTAAFNKQTLNINLNRFIYRLTHSLTQSASSIFWLLLFAVLFISFFYHSLNYELAPQCDQLNSYARMKFYNTPLLRWIFHSLPRGNPIWFLFASQAECSTLLCEFTGVLLVVCGLSSRFKWLKSRYYGSRVITAEMRVVFYFNKCAQTISIAYVRTEICVCIIFAIVDMCHKLYTFAHIVWSLKTI